MSFILKALSTLDGIARTLDPNYNLVVAAQPFIRSVAIAERGNIVSKLSRQATNYLKSKLIQPNANKLLIKQLEQQLAQQEVDLAIRSQVTDRLIQRVDAVIRNLIYVCLTGFGSIALFLLMPTQPVFAIALGGLASVGALWWLRSLIRLVFQTRLMR
jgi:predicted unusual protein kinase regulating ubiquinone biosynthesis (AarF/ABC1/UbiB family)